MKGYFIIKITGKLHLKKVFYYQNYSGLAHTISRLALDATVEGYLYCQNLLGQPAPELTHRDMRYAWAIEVIRISIQEQHVFRWV